MTFDPRDYEPTDWPGLTSEPEPAHSIELWLGSDRSGEVPSCLIVSWPTGVHYTNQVGGGACHHPNLEGFLIPIPRVLDFTPCSPPVWGPLADEHADAADALLKRLEREGGGVAYTGYQARVNRDKLPLSCEAWIWLTLDRMQADEGLKGFPDKLEAIWTYENSD